MSELSKEVKDLLAATKRTYPKMNYVAVDKYEEVELYERKPILISSARSLPPLSRSVGGEMNCAIVA